MTATALHRWSRLVHAPLALFLAPVALWPVTGAVVGVRLLLRRRHAARHGDPGVLARERDRRARDDVDLVSAHQRRPDARSDDTAEVALAGRLADVRRDAPDSREARLVDVLRITRP